MLQDVAMTRLEELVARIAPGDGPVSSALGASEWHELRAELAALMRDARGYVAAMDRWDVDRFSGQPHVIRESAEALADALATFRARLS